MSTFWVVVDDTDPRINYTGSWSLMTGDGLVTSRDTLNSISIAGDVFNNTVHNPASNQEETSSFTFNFNGTSFLGVYGTRLTPSEPTIMACLLDGQLLGPTVNLDGFPVTTIGSTVNDGSPMNNQLLCGVNSRNFPNATSGEHQLFVNTTSSGLVLDYIVYETVANASLDGDVVQMGNGQLRQAAIDSDPNLEFGSGWVNTEISDTGSGARLGGKYTNTSGSSVTAKFNGTSIAMYGDLFGSTQSNSAIYQLDDQSPQSFTLDPPARGHNNTPNQVFFNLSSLQPREHTLVVTHNGNDEGVPLSFDYFLITSLTAEEQAALAASSTPTPTPSPSPSPEPTASSSNKTGAIAGGVIGGVAFLALLILGLLLWHKRRRDKEGAKAAVADPFTGWQYTSAAYDPYSPESPAGLEMTMSPKSKSDMSKSPVSRAGGGFAGYGDNGGINAPQGQNEELGRMRMAYLKLQQRLAIMQGREDPTPAQAEADRAPGPSRILHTDSGLRMREGGGFSRPEDVEEVPPDYTAT